MAEVPAPSSAPVTVSAATPEQGSLVFDVPADTEIKVDGVVVGRGTLSVPRVSVGSHEIVLRHPEFGSWKRTASVSAGEPTRVGFSAAAMREARATTQERRARQALADGHREDALRITTDALAMAPAHQGLNDFIGQLVRDALNQTVAARKAAERAGRAARRSSAFNLGDSHFERAERSHNAGRLADAIPAYWAAQAQFERAVKEAK